MARNVLVFALLLIVFGTVHSYTVPSEAEAWANWKASHGRLYSTEEEELDRWTTWIKNKRLVDEHNRAYAEGRTSFKMTMNDFADQDLGKIRKRFDFQTKVSNTERKQTSSSSPSSSSGIPSSWDWRQERKVSGVVNQGRVGSAPAYVVADAVASYSAIFNQTYLYRLDVQELIDCCLPYSIAFATVFDCVSDLGGLCMNGSYHSGSAPNVCNNTSCKAVATCNVGKAVPTVNESALAEAVYTTPVVVYIDASLYSFRAYEGGVYSDRSCSQTRLNHYLLLVGYGVTPLGTEYWVCKNNWGKSWGENGYIKIARNQNNMCGIASSAIYPSKNLMYHE